MKSNSNTNQITLGKALFSLIDPYYRYYQWVRDKVAPANAKPVIEALKVAGYVTTVEAIIDNMPDEPRLTIVRDSCLPFLYKGNDVGLLFTHGFGSNPEALREMAKYLHETEGYTCRAVRLKGHGTSVQDMERTNFIDWYKSVEEGYKKLKKEVSRVILVGHSLGATLSLLLSVYHDVEAIVTISPPLKLHRPDAKYLPLISWFLRYWPTKRSEAELYEQRGHHYYPYRPLKCVTSLFDLMEVTRKRLHKVNVPIYAAIGLQDPRVNKENIDLLFQEIRSDYKESYYYNGNHSVHLGEAKEPIHESVRQFLRKVVNKEFSKKS